MVTLVFNALHAFAGASGTQPSIYERIQVTIHHGVQNVNAKSLMGLMTLAAAKGTELEFAAEGEDAKEALAALRKLLADKFGEKE